jgi:uncharacterized cupredoxin-like copper-binding protein
MGKEARIMRRASVLVVALVLAVVATGCGGDEPAGGGGGGGGEPTGGSDGTVKITLQEWAVANDPAEVSAGSVTFEITNTGPNDTHEFVVIKTDLGLTDLPTDETGAVDESGEGIEVIDEVEEVEVGASETLTTDLEAGAYVLVCNIYDEVEKEAHYQQGMRTSLTVD